MVAAGWYPDPQNPSAHRYYDGQSWTEHIRSGAGPGATPPAPVQPVQPAQQTPPAQQIPPAWSMPPSPARATATPAPAPVRPAQPVQPAWGPQAQQPWQPGGTSTWQQAPPGGAYPHPYPPGPARRSRRGLIIAVVAVLVAGLLSGGYFLFLRGDKAPMLTYGGAKIKDAGGVLKRAESNVATIVTTRHGAKSPDTRCYFAVPDNPADGAKKSDADTNLLCGPVLFVDGDTTKTFLSFPLSKSGSGGTVSLTAATAPRTAEPDAPPADMKLKRPDGKSAPSGEKLAVPKPPPAKRAALLDVDLGSATPPKRLDGAKMISLNTGVRLVAAGIVQRYGHGDAARSAAPGEQLIAFRVADAPGEKASQTTTGLLKVLVPGSPVRPVPHADASDSYVVVAVPSGSAPQLQLTAGGYPQTLSLPSGEPGPKNLKVLLRTHRTLTLTQKAVIPVSVSNGSSTAPLSFSATARFAALDFWPPGHEGAHPNSTANALLSVRLTYTDSSAPGKTFGFDSQLLRLKLPDGRTVAARNIAPSGRVFNVFEVPATFTSGTVLVTGSESSGSITLRVVKTASFPIAFAAN